MLTEPSRNRRGTVAPPPRAVRSSATVRRLGEPLGGSPPNHRTVAPALAAATLPVAPPAVAGPSPGNVAADGLSAPSQPDLHPADELAAIREEIKALKAREAEVREVILAHHDARRGLWNAATVETGWQSRIDARALQRLFPEVAKAVTSQVHVVFVRTTRIGQ